MSKHYHNRNEYKRRSVGCIYNRSNMDNMRQNLKGKMCIILQVYKEYSNFIFYFVKFSLKN